MLIWIKSAVTCSPNLEIISRIKILLAAAAYVGGKSEGKCRSSVLPLSLRRTLIPFGEEFSRWPPANDRMEFRRSQLRSRFPARASLSQVKAADQVQPDG